ncbi:MAG: MATE family efflux transporter, partial [Streptococcaceae bacterium]|nr:MATE family efflux transporter [Streptococcaceae bacterium]
MKDLTQGSPIKLILLFAIPLLIGNIFQQIYVTIDMMIIGQTLGTYALAAVGATMSVNFLIVGFGMGTTSGLSIVIAQRFGAKDYAGVKRSFATSIVISVVVAIFLTILSLILVEPILRLMQTPEAIFNQAQAFVSVLFMGIIATILFTLMVNVLRALGDSKKPLIFFVITSVVNIILVFLFIRGFGMGVQGASLATVLSHLTAALCALIYIYRYIPPLQISLKDFKAINRLEIVAHTKLAFPMAIQLTIISIGAVVLQIAVNSLGTDAVAASAAGMRIDQFAILPMVSFGGTMVTFVAQNYGAKQYGRIIQGIRQALCVVVGFGAVVGLLVNLFGQNIAGLFINEHNPQIFANVQTYFNVNASMYFVLATVFILRYALQGLGQTVVPTIAGFMELGGRVLGALVL